MSDDGAGDAGGDTTDISPAFDPAAEFDDFDFVAGTDQSHTDIGDPGPGAGSGQQPDSLDFAFDQGYDVSFDFPEATGIGDPQFNDRRRVSGIARSPAGAAKEEDEGTLPGQSLLAGLGIMGGPNLRKPVLGA